MQSEEYRKEMANVELLENLIELTKAKKLKLADEQIDPEMKSIEIQRISAIEDALSRRKEASEKHQLTSIREVPIDVADLSNIK